jgi:hypothetical protein
MVLGLWFVDNRNPKFIIEKHNPYDFQIPQKKKLKTKIYVQTKRTIQTWRSFQLFYKSFPKARSQQTYQYQFENDAWH